MPLFEYILLGLLGSSGTAVLDGSLPAGALTLGADAIVQPNGGVVPLASQETPKKDDSRKVAAGGHIKTQSVKIVVRKQHFKTRHHKNTHKPGKRGN